MSIKKVRYLLWLFLLNTIELFAVSTVTVICFWVMIVPAIICPIRRKIAILYLPILSIGAVNEVYNDREINTQNIDRRDLA